jgi:hypothetical protein
MAFGLLTGAFKKIVAVNMMLPRFKPFRAFLFGVNDLLTPLHTSIAPDPDNAVIVPFQRIADREFCGLDE